MGKRHHFTLRFTDRELEKGYLESSFVRERTQGRTAIIVGTFVYLLYGILDLWFVPEEAQSSVWMIRLSALSVPLVVYLLSYSSVFMVYRHLLLASVGLAAGAGLISMLTYLPIESTAYFYPGLVLATFFTYNFIGTRFVYALCVDLILLVAYNLVFGVFLDYPLKVLASHDFFIVSANLIGGIAGYLNESQKRLRAVPPEHSRTLSEEHHGSEVSI